VHTAFGKLSEDDGGQVLLMKLGYAALNIVNVSLAVYKCNTMGLFPTTPSDWLEFLPHPVVCLH
jgi:hypothetical protein